MAEPKNDFDLYESSMFDIKEYFKKKNFWGEDENDNDNDNKNEINEDEYNNINFGDRFEKAFYKCFKDTKNESEETIEIGEENTHINNINLKLKEDSLIKNQEKRENGNKLTQSFSNFISDNNPKSESEEVPNNYKCLQDNKLSGKQFINLNENSDKITRENTPLKKGNINSPTFSCRKHGRLCGIKNATTNFRDQHDKFTPDNKITKIKSFIIDFLKEVSNQLSEKITKGKQYYLHEICGYQAGHRTVKYDKELMKKKLKIILNDTKDDYNKNIINILCTYEEINTFLELKLEDIFNYLTYKEGIRISGTNKIIEGVKDQYNFSFLDELNLYNLYQNELNKKDEEDKEIIEDQIKKDFVKLINGRKSKIWKKNKK